MVSTTQNRSQVPDITDEHVLDKLGELKRYGFGEMNVKVRDGLIISVNKTESLVRSGKG